MNKVLLATTAFALVVAAVPSRAQQATTKDQLIGSWKVLSLKATTADRVSYPLGEQVAGYVTITPTRFWLLFVDATRLAREVGSVEYRHVKRAHNELADRLVNDALDAEE